MDGAKITKHLNGAGWCAITVRTDKSSAAAWTCSVTRLPSRTADGSLFHTLGPLKLKLRWLVDVSTLGQLHMIEGDVPIYLKFALKVTHLFRKHQFCQISLKSAAAVRASEKVQLSLMGSRQCVFHRAIDEPCALPRCSAKGGSNENVHIWRCFSFLRCRS